MTKTIFFDREPIIAEIPIANDLCFALQRANRIISRGADSALRATGLTAEQTLLLAAIAEAGSPRAADLSRSLGIDASTIAANLKPLMRQELVFAPVDITDRRARRLFLTVAGSDRLERGIKQFQEYEDGLALECDGNTDLGWPLSGSQQFGRSMPLGNTRPPSCLSSFPRNVAELTHANGTYIRCGNHRLVHRKSAPKQG